MTPDERTITTGDGCRLAVHRLGAGRAVVLVHGFISSANTNWIAPGTARRLVDAGFAVIAPDLRGHGQSDAPQSAEHYPADVLPADLEAVITGLELRDYDLVGYSLGARTALRLVVRAGVPLPRRLVLGGMGLSGIRDSRGRTDWFAQAIRRRDEPDLSAAERTVARFIKSMKTDPVAAIHLLYSQVDTTADALRQVALPALVIAGKGDQDNGSARDLAAALPNGRYAEVPGTHMSAVLESAFGEAIAEFLSG
jgi:pimeloyl-ACP methyl ester carboxylesterase